MAATTTAAAAMERARKKPRLTPSTTATATASAASRLKSGLAPPSAAPASSSRLHYAFGSRLPPLAGKENAPTNTTAKPSVKLDALGSKKPDAALKQHRTKTKRPSLSEESTASTPSGKTTTKSQSATPSTPATKDETTTQAKKELAHKTPPVVALQPPPVVALLSPVKPVRFEATTATDPDFWKCRQQFARAAMLELQDLEKRLNALSESPSLASV